MCIRDRYGSYLQNHASHLFVFVVPDFVGEESVFPLAQSDPELFNQALDLKKLGNDLCTLVGGRSIHPIDVYKRQDYTTTITSPKKFFLPSEEVLMRFDAEENGVTDFAIDLKPRVLFGVHPCDINALNRLDLVYKDCAYPDPYYTKRRENTLIVGLGCMPGPACFCNLCRCV